MKQLLSVVWGVIGLMQVVHAQQPWTIDFGVGAGAMRPSYVVNNVQSGVSRQVAATYNGQFGGWVMFSPNAYAGLETGINVAGLGSLLEKSEFGSTAVLQHTYWLQVPVSLVGKLPLRDSSNFFLKVGVYGGFGLLGINYIPDSYTGSASHTFTFGNDGAQQRLDFGGLLSVGYRLRTGYSLAVGYQYGKADLAPAKGAYEQRNRAYSLTLGYQF